MTGHELLRTLESMSSNELSREFPAVSEAALKLLLERCIDPIQERIYEYKEERKGYEGYPQRQARYDRHIAEDEALLAEVRAAVQWTGE